MNARKAAAAAALGIAVIAGSTWVASRRQAPVGGGPDGASPATSPLLQQIAELRAELAAATDERRALAARVDRLRSKLDRLSDLGGDVEAESDPFRPAPLEAPKAEPAPDSHARSGGFDEAALLEHGVPPAEVARLREIYESSEMDELYLRNRAARGGWLYGPDFRHQIQKLWSEVRNEVGDEDYDRMLFASGKNNRVVLSHILHDSPAMEAGLQNGDLVLRYDDEPVFTPHDLQRATVSGEAGQLIRMYVLRDAEEVVIYLPAGPIGARLKGARHASSDW